MPTLYLEGGLRVGSASDVMSTATQLMDIYRLQGANSVVGRIRWSISRYWIEPSVQIIHIIWQKYGRTTTWLCGSLLYKKDEILVILRYLEC